MADNDRASVNKNAAIDSFLYSKIQFSQRFWQFQAIAAVAYDFVDQYNS